MTRRRLLAALAMAAAIPVGLYAESTRSEHGLFQFSSSTVISSSEVNENFDILGQHMSTYQGAISVDGDGNVGVGTEKPEGKLHIYDEVILGYGETSCPEGYYLSIDLDGSGDPTQDDTCSSDALVVTKEGNVGIGEVNPGARLHVAGDIYSSAEVFSYGTPSSLAINYRTIVDKDSANGLCPSSSTAIYTPRSYSGKTGDEICAADQRGLTSCMAVRAMIVRLNNDFTTYDPYDLECSSNVPFAWPWGYDISIPDSFDTEWSGITHVVCCQ